MSVGGKKKSAGKGLIQTPWYQTLTLYLRFAVVLVVVCLFVCFSPTPWWRCKWILIILSEMLLISAAWLGGRHYALSICIWRAAITCPTCSVHRHINKPALWFHLSCGVRAGAASQPAELWFITTVLEVYMRHTHTDPSPSSPPGALSYASTPVYSSPAMLHVLQPAD